ncbi:MAG: single-stranded-DNA-specific exonuclease RecJ [Candidatus Levybacteria bacterium]|nr:single-stranded-DNA-specific exonuclease RecJ [Candidatus Levybacteria bacterium]
MKDEIRSKKKWKILSESGIRNQKMGIRKLIKILLNNRGIKTKKETEGFLNPRLESVTVENVGINKKELKKAIIRIKDAIKKNEQIVIFGDYDVDGICGTAILWETLNKLGAKVIPYIPHRAEEGYGLSITGISNIKNKIPVSPTGGQNIKLIITVDNGIVANKAVEFANKNEIDVIITDHHVASKKLPDALAIVHTTKLCGTGVAWLLSKNVILSEAKNPGDPSAMPQDDNMNESHLELVALATVADLVPLQGANRTLLKSGLESLGKTKRVGLLELFKEGGLDKNSIGVYEIGHIIAPRLNAMGRLEYAMDSLRLLCTNNKKKAEELAMLLGNTNRERQELTMQTVLHAKDSISDNGLSSKKLLFVAHKNYEQGIIGLVAGKMVDEYYRPSIVVSIGEKISKGSARSVSGFNIIEFIRESSSYLVDAGGHPMAAGFTVETTKLLELRKDLEERVQSLIDGETLARSLNIDCELPLSLVNQDVYDALQRLAPFGMKNPEPAFMAKDVEIEDLRLVGYNSNHLKLRLRDSSKTIDAIAFGMGEMSKEVHVGDKISVVYVIDENVWNGNKKLQLKIKDIRRFIYLT